MLTRHDNENIVVDASIEMKFRGDNNELPSYVIQAKYRERYINFMLHYAIYYLTYNKQWNVIL